MATTSEFRQQLVYIWQRKDYIGEENLQHLREHHSEIYHAYVSYLNSKMRLDHMIELFAEGDL